MHRNDMTRTSTDTRPIFNDWERMVIAELASGKRERRDLAIAILFAEPRKDLREDVIMTNETKHDTSQGQGYGEDWGSYGPDQGRGREIENLQSACRLMAGEIAAGCTHQTLKKSWIEVETCINAALATLSQSAGLREALRSADWSNVSIGNKALIQAAIEALGTTGTVEHPK